MPRIPAKHTVAAALAASALAASPAVAAAHQDLRGEHARDAARAAEHPRGPGHPSEVTATTRIGPGSDPLSRVDSRGLTPSHDDDTWLIVGIAVAAAGVVAGSGAAAAHRYRVRARRAVA